MIDIKHGFILICFLSIWSCKEKGKADTDTPIIEDSTVVKDVTDNDLTIAETDTLTIKKDNLVVKEKSNIKKILNDDARVNLVFKAEGEFRAELKKELQKRLEQRKQQRPKQ